MKKSFLALVISAFFLSSSFAHASLFSWWADEWADAWVSQYLNGVRDILRDFNYNGEISFFGLPPIISWHVSSSEGNK